MISKTSKNSSPHFTHQLGRFFFFHPLTHIQIVAIVVGTPSPRVVPIVIFSAYDKLELEPDSEPPDVLVDSVAAGAEVPAVLDWSDIKLVVLDVDNVDSDDTDFPLGEEVSPAPAPVAIEVKAGLGFALGEYAAQICSKVDCVRTASVEEQVTAAQLRRVSLIVSW